MGRKRNPKKFDDYDPWDDIRQYRALLHRVAFPAGEDVPIRSSLDMMHDGGKGFGECNDAKLRAQALKELAELGERMLNYKYAKKRAHEGTNGGPIEVILKRED